MVLKYITCLLESESKTNQWIQTKNYDFVRLFKYIMHAFTILPNVTYQVKFVFIRVSANFMQNITLTF